MVADLCVVGGYAQYAIRPARFLVPVPDDVDAAEAVCMPLAYLTAFQMLTRYRRLSPGETILVIGASGTVGTALLDLSRHLGLKAIGTCSAARSCCCPGWGCRRPGNLGRGARSAHRDGELKPRFAAPARP